MFVVGLVGKTAAGKGVVAGILEEKLKVSGLSVSRVRFSDSLRDFVKELRARGISLAMSKDTLISIAEAGREAFVPNLLARAAIHRTRKIKADVCIWDGLRWPNEDVPALRFFKDSILVAITASDRVRYNRFVKRLENVGDEEMTFKDFMTMDSRDTERFIDEIISGADVSIHNNCDCKGIAPRPRVVMEKVKELVESIISRKKMRSVVSNS